jgi:hypothetical protein
MHAVKASKGSMHSAFKDITKPESEKESSDTLESKQLSQ